MFYILKPQDVIIRCLFYILLFKVAQYFWMHPYIFAYFCVPLLPVPTFLENGSIFSHQIFWRCFGITLSPNKKIVHSVRSHFGLFLGSFQSILLYFLERVQSFLIKLCYIFCYIFYSNGYCTKLFTVMFPSARGHFCFFFCCYSISWELFVFLWNFPHIFLIIFWWYLETKKILHMGVLYFAGGYFELF